jgi:hypothetical protein
MHLFPSAALLAALLTASSAFGDEARPVDPASGNSVKAFALEWFARLQAGEIDRAQMTARA